MFTEKSFNALKILLKPLKPANVKISNSKIHSFYISLASVGCYFRREVWSCAKVCILLLHKNCLSVLWSNSRVHMIYNIHDPKTLKYENIGIKLAADVFLILFMSSASCFILYLNLDLKNRTRCKLIIWSLGSGGYVQDTRATFSNIFNEATHNPTRYRTRYPACT